MNMAIHGPFLSSALKSCLGSDFCLGSGWMRSRVARKVMTNRTTQTIAHRPMVICQPLALLPCPNLATRGRVKPTTMSCAIMAATKRNDDRRVRSLTSPVMTPLSAEYGVLRSEEHTSELQSLRHLVCRLLLEKTQQNCPSPGWALPRRAVCSPLARDPAR